LRRNGQEKLLFVFDDGSKSLVLAAWTDLRGEKGKPPALTAMPGPRVDLLMASALAPGRTREN
jgi:hypothetical protein